MTDEDHEDYVVVRLEEADAGELLTLQRAAYAIEAQIYGDPFLPALTQSLSELEGDFAKPVLGVRLRGRLVGSVRWKIEGAVAHIGRLIVAPDMQGRGVGTALLEAAELESRMHEFALFTGDRSDANIRLYQRNGYVVRCSETLRPGVTLVHLTKVHQPDDQSSR